MSGGNMKNSDLQKLITIYNKIRDNKILSKGDLIFIYEVEDKIDAYGYRKKMIMNFISEKRDFKKDLSFVFICAEEQISNDKQDIIIGKEIIFLKVI